MRWSTEPKRTELRRWADTPEAHPVQAVSDPRVYRIQRGAPDGGMVVAAVVAQGGKAGVFQDDCKNCSRRHCQLVLVNRLTHCSVETCPTIFEHDNHDCRFPTVPNKYNCKLKN